MAAGLDYAARELAALVRADGQPADEQGIELILRRLFPRVVALVDIARADRYDPLIVAALREARTGRRSWEGGPLATTGERPLQSSGALVGDTVVLARYASGVFPDGDLPVVVERICHAIAASLAARQLARARRGDRGAVTLLAGETALNQLRVLNRSLGRELAQVSLRLGARMRREQVGVYGEAAWNATVFDCAGQLDVLAREHGGEAFELEGALCCLVPTAAVASVQGAVRQLAGRSVSRRRSS